MQALSDDQQIERIEKKVDLLDVKVDNVRAEARSDYRTLLGIQLAMFMTMILGFAGILLQHHL
jgi:hypothetical protein